MTDHTGLAPAVARRVWRVLEPIHAVNYFAPEVHAAMKDLGLKGFWMGYFAARSAPFGAVGSGAVVATFYNFRPSMVVRAIPDAWSFASPADVLATRTAAADVALRRALGDEVEGDAIVEAAVLARRAAEACRPEGRPIFAANAELAWPSEPHLQLWHAAGLLREHRGDGHIAALVSAGVDAVESHVTFAGTGQIGRQVLQSSRSWTDEEWAEAEGRLRRRGWLGDDGMLTPDGRAVRQRIEDHTDELALAPYELLGPEECARLEDLAKPLARRVTKEIPIPLPNPTGVDPS